MSRVIKFRAWNPYDKKWENPERCALRFNGERYWYVDVKPSWPDVAGHSLEVEYVQQFTGLLDKNGKEIYEGDVLKNGWIEKSSNYFRFAVEWNSERGGYYLPDSYNDEYMCNLGTELQEDTWETIGNIYENPELLTK